MDSGNPGTGTPAPTQAVLNNMRLAGPTGLFITSDGHVGVVDSVWSRISLFPPVDSPASPWPSPQTRTGPSPASHSHGIFPAANQDITSVLTSHYVNAGNAEASQSSLTSPPSRM